jgi:hypothetical protein
MSHVQGFHLERIGNREGKDRYLVDRMVCAVGDEGLGIVGIDENGGSVSGGQSVILPVKLGNQSDKSKESSQLKQSNSGQENGAYLHSIGCQLKPGRLSNVVAENILN